MPPQSTGHTFAYYRPPSPLAWQLPPSYLDDTDELVDMYERWENDQIQFDGDQAQYWEELAGPATTPHTTPN